MKFPASHLRDARFEPRGLRSFFECRDLGIREAKGGKVLADVIRGWIEFDYEGVGRVRAEAGICVHQPPGIGHDGIGHSDDLELTEITMPADFETVEIASVRRAAARRRSHSATRSVPYAGRPRGSARMGPTIDGRWLRPAG